MAKRYANLALSYAIIAMVFGVFYREFTKFSHFVGQTNLSFLHTHYFMLGMFFFLVLMVVEKAFSFSGQNIGKLLIAYQAGLNITGLGFLMRGLTHRVEPWAGRLYFWRCWDRPHFDGGLYYSFLAEN